MSFIDLFKPLLKQFFVISLFIGLAACGDNNNVPPVADADISATTNEDTVVSIPLTDSDLEGNALTYAIVANPTNGTVTLTDNIASYIPNANYNGSDNFTYKVNDGTVDSAPVTVGITITAVNDDPVAADAISATTNEDTATPITLTGSDTDGDTLSYSLVAQPANGIVTLTDNIASYIPNTNYNGNDSFSFKVNDGTVDSALATVSITITAANDAPVADAISATTNEDTVASVTLTGSDLEGNALTYAINVSPTNGAVTLSGNTATYIPNTNYNGSDSFTFKANDGTVDSAPATVSITITAVSDAPVADAISATVIEDAVASITLTGSDADGDTLTYAIVASPANGTVTLSGETVTYTPNPNYSGSDSFTFKVNDGTVDSATVDVSITVIAVNDAPVAGAGITATTNEDTATPITLTGSDTDGDTLSYSLVAQPANGTVTLTDNIATYTPSANYNGSDSFSFTANDGTVDSAPATVSLAVIAVSDAPVADAISATVNEDAVASITLTGSDADGDTLTYAINTGSTNGAVVISGNTVTYTPNPNFNGSDSFTFKTNDGTVDSASATVSITVIAVNDAPVVTGTILSATTNEDTATPITLIGSDADGDTLSYSLVAQPTNGTVTLIGNTATYTPNANYNGTDSFTFTANDGTVDSAPATVSITITAVQDAPVADAISATVNEDAVASITLTGSDADGDTLTYVINTGATNGTVALSGNTVTYTPTTNYNGSDSFSFKVNDGALDSATATVSITIIAVNDAPIADFDIQETTNEDTAITITLTGSDADGDTLSYIKVSDPTNGTVTITGNTATYTPNTNYNGSDIFAFKANDGTVDSAPVTLSITITAVNDTPVADGKLATTNEDAATTITLTGSDADGDTLTYAIVGNPTNGTVTLSGNTATYTPSANYSGSDSFTFKVSDSTVASLATVSITILNLPEQPANVQATANSTQVSLSWDAAPDATAYDVCHASESISDPANCATFQNGTLLLGSTSPTLITGLTNGTTYYFVVIPKNANGEGDVSSEVSATPTGLNGFNDTGMTLCGDYAFGGSGVHNKDINCVNTTDTDGDPIPQGQDAQLGRDADSATNNNSDGHKGFSFTKLDSSGIALANQSGTTFSCVKDNVTGLIWESKQTATGLHNKDDLYTWYNTDAATNGGVAGTENLNASCEGGTNNTTCNTQAYVVRVNTATLCTANDWRLPTRKELRSLSRHDITWPAAIDATYFPNTAYASYWLSSTLAFRTYEAWTVTFTTGRTGGGPKSDSLRVRLVRSGQ